MRLDESQQMECPVQQSEIVIGSDDYQFVAIHLSILQQVSFISQRLQAGTISQFVYYLRGYGRTNEKGILPPIEGAETVISFASKPRNPFSNLIMDYRRVADVPDTMTVEMRILGIAANRFSSSIFLYFIHNVYPSSANDMRRLEPRKNNNGESECEQQFSFHLSNQRKCRIMRHC